MAAAEKSLGIVTPKPIACAKSKSFQSLRVLNEDIFTERRSRWNFIQRWEAAHVDAQCSELNVAVYNRMCNQIFRCCTQQFHHRSYHTSAYNFQRDQIP
jgi:arginyl-tRNA--protein-N-Asp/Glu arginylyltransferase